METDGNGKNETTVVHHSQSRGTSGVGKSGSTPQQKQVRGDRKADSRTEARPVGRPATAVGKILRGLIANARAQIKLLENQVELWEDQLENLEESDVEPAE